MPTLWRNLKPQLEGSAHLLPAGMWLLPDPREAAEGRLSPSPVFLNNVRTVSQEGAPDGEGNSAGHDPAAPTSKGGGREGGCSFLWDSWCPGSTGLRRHRMGEGGWVTASSPWVLRGLSHLLCITNVPETITELDVAQQKSGPLSRSWDQGVCRLE